jgi:hypothetical protein
MNTLDGVPPFLDRTRLVGIYSILNAYKNCPHQMARRYVIKDQPFIETPEMAWGNKVHSAMELRVGGKKPLPVDMQQWEQFCTPFDRVYDTDKSAIAVELKLGVTWNMRPCDFWDKEVWFRGKIDVTLVNHKTDEMSAYIADWKTGGSKYEDPFELATNAVLLKAKHPGLTRICGSYIWLKENRVGELHDLSDVTKTWAEMKRLMGEIEEKKKSGQWDKTKSGLCGWCSVRDCEHWHEARK